MAELKLLDPNRKAVLLLPSTQLHVWFTFWMYESDDQEAYPSTERLVESTGITNKPIIFAKKELIRKGWLRRVTGFASDRYSKPTRGSHSTPIYRVDDPTKDGHGTNHIRYTIIEDAKGTILDIVPVENNSGESPLFPCPNLETVEKLHPFADETVEKLPMENLHTRFIPVSTSLPLSESLPVAVASPTATPAYAGGSEHQSLRDSSSTATTKATTTATTKTKAPASGSVAAIKVKHNPKYDAPFPYDFDTWSQPDRTLWCAEHSRESSRADAGTSRSSSSPTATPPGSAPPPAQAVPQFKCPACDFSKKEAYRVAEHIQKEHPELGQQSFRINCPVDGCWQGFLWNKVANNKEKAEADLALHTLVQHTPTSSKYDPGEVCPDCQCWLSSQKAVAKHKEPGQCHKRPTNPS